MYKYNTYRHGYMLRTNSPLEFMRMMKYDAAQVGDFVFFTMTDDDYDEEQAEQVEWFEFPALRKQVA